jgi:hypothetical protein
MAYQNSSLLSTLTVGDLREILREEMSGRTGEVVKSHGRLVFGLDGIRELFHCSHKQAQYYKDHIITEAVSQHGRKIVVDADKALELFNQRRKRHD